MGRVLIFGDKLCEILFTNLLRTVQDKEYAIREQHRLKVAFGQAGINDHIHNQRKIKPRSLVEFYRPAIDGPQSSTPRTNGPTSLYCLVKHPRYEMNDATMSTSPGNILPCSRSFCTESLQRTWVSQNYGVAFKIVFWNQ